MEGLGADRLSSLPDQIDRKTMTAEIIRDLLGIGAIAPHIDHAVIGDISWCLNRNLSLARI
jgi:hypothetical protein